METQALLDQLDRGVMLALLVNQVLWDQLVQRVHWGKMDWLDHLVFLVSLACQVLSVPLAIQDNLDLQGHLGEPDRLALRDQEEMQVRQDHLVKAVNQEHRVQMDLLVHQDRMESLVSQEPQDNEVILVQPVPVDSQGRQDLLEVGANQGHRVRQEQTAIEDRWDLLGLKDRLDHKEVQGHLDR